MRPEQWYELVIGAVFSIGGIMTIWSRSAIARGKIKPKSADDAEWFHKNPWRLLLLGWGFLAYGIYRMIHLL
jgi:hypothetical protein